MITIHHLTNPCRIEKELSRIEQGESRTWAQLYLLLEAIDKSGYWHSDAGSLTRWVEDNSVRIRLKPSMAWRILSAGRFLSKIFERFSERGLPTPLLKNLPKHVTPDVVELLSKLDRVLPSESFIALAKRAFEGSVKRKDLRSTWEIYRPLLRGQTTRGRGVQVPKIDYMDPGLYRSVREAEVLEAFKSVGPSWLGIDNPSIYKVFIHINPEGYSLPPDSYLLTAVVVVKPRNSQLQYHGICMPHFSHDIDSLYSTRISYCDYIWIFTGKSFAEVQGDSMREDIGPVPRGIGVLDVVGKDIVVLKKAEAIDGSGIRKIDTASALLTHLAKTA